MNKILLLAGHDIDVLQGADIKADIPEVYKKGILFKILNKNKHLIKYSLDTWKKNIKLYNVVIIFDTYYNDGLIDYLYKMNSRLRVIFYCWNTIKTISKRTNIESILNDKRIEVWSYNYSDCKQYSMIYNQQFWNKRLISMNNMNTIDISFIGSPKQRIEFLQNIYTYCQNNNLITYFYITGYECEFNRNKGGKFLPYTQYISEIASKSHAILDLVTDENVGLTLRPLEALFLGKKLITNYSDIVNESFYNVNNVYIIGKDKRTILEFLSLPYKKISEKIISSYDCISWIKRFGVEE